MAGKQPLAQYHLPVQNLTLAKRFWRVGNVMFRQQGWLNAHLGAVVDRNPPDAGLPQLVRYAAELRADAQDVTYATVEVRARTIDEAAERAREAIAVARLFQRVVVPAFNLDAQTFGLQADIGSPVDRYWVTGGRGLPGRGWRRHGIMADWTFTAPMLRQIDRDARFQFLSRAIGTDPTARSDVQRRLVLALRFLNRATLMVPPPIRVVMLALVLEVLLSDRKGGDLTHRIARRAAYLTCGRPNDPHGQGARPACYVLAALDTDEVEANASARAAAGLSTTCSWYEHIRDIYRARNWVMHRGYEEFRRSQPTQFESWVDDVVLEFAAWADRTGKADRALLDAEIRSLVAAGVT